MSGMPCHSLLFNMYVRIYYLAIQMCHSIPYLHSKNKMQSKYKQQSQLDTFSCAYLSASFKIKSSSLGISSSLIIFLHFGLWIPWIFLPQLQKMRWSLHPEEFPLPAADSKWHSQCQATENPPNQDFSERYKLWILNPVDLACDNLHKRTAHRCSETFLSDWGGRILARTMLRVPPQASALAAGWWEMNFLSCHSSQTFDLPILKETNYLRVRMAAFRGPFTKRCITRSLFVILEDKSSHFIRYPTQ